MGRGLFVGISLLLGACRPFGEAPPYDPVDVPPRTPWTLDCRLDAGGREAVRDAFRAWEGWRPGTFGDELPCVGPGEGIRGGVLVSAPGTEDGASADADRWTGSAGVRLHAGWFRRPDPSRSWTVRHELGHVLGMGHTDDPTCLMHPSGLVEEPCLAELELLGKTKGEESP
jgi:hypothetical protein